MKFSKSYSTSQTSSRLVCCLRNFEALSNLRLMTSGLSPIDLAKYLFGPRAVVQGPAYWEPASDDEGDKDDGEHKPDDDDAAAVDDDLTDKVDSSSEQEADDGEEPTEGIISRCLCTLGVGLHDHASSWGS